MSEYEQSHYGAQTPARGANRVLAAPEDAYFKQTLHQYTREQALDEILPRFKIVAEQRATHTHQDGSSSSWDYAEEAKAWDLLARLSRLLLSSSLPH